MVNTELQNKVDELSKINDDMKNCSTAPKSDHFS